MISALTCLLLPFLGNCSNFVRDVPTLTALVHHRASYTGRNVEVTGRVRRLDQWTSRVEGSEELFLVCDGTDCVRVFMHAHSPIADGRLVTVSGQYFEALHVGRHTYYNEIEGSEVLPRE